MSDQDGLFPGRGGPASRELVSLALPSPPSSHALCTSLHTHTAHPYTPTHTVHTLTHSHTCCIQPDTFTHTCCAHPYTLTLTCCALTTLTSTRTSLTHSTCYPGPHTHCFTRESHTHTHTHADSGVAGEKASLSAMCRGRSEPALVETANTVLRSGQLFRTLPF